MYLRSAMFVGRALILLQQCLERGGVTPSEVAEILEKHAEQPEEIFPLIEGMKFSDASEITHCQNRDRRSVTDRLGWVKTTILMVSL